MQTVNHATALNATTSPGNLPRLHFYGRDSGRDTPAVGRDRGQARDVLAHHDTEADYPEPDPATFIWPEQPILDDVMDAGLLAVRHPLLPIHAQRSLHAHENADPWANGISRVLAMEPLVGFFPWQWISVQRGCASLFNSHAAEMRRLGWSAEDAFGIHPEAPANAVHCHGLGIMLGDSQVVEMTEAMARLKLRNGVYQTFTRIPMKCAVPIWTVGRVA